MCEELQINIKKVTEDDEENINSSISKKWFKVGKILELKLQK
jgi:hypothetical protein